MSREFTYEIAGIFPTPVLLTTLPRDFTEEEMDVVDECRYDVHQNVGNKTSNNNYVLNHPSMSQLLADCTIALNCYIERVLSPLPENKVEGYITQSWINYTKENEFHHKHSHPNSYISGVLYFDADDQTDRINFYNERHSIIHNTTVSNYTPFNTDKWYFPVKTKSIIIFPSSLVHDVESKIGSNIRTSLSFNSFVRGTFGDNKALTELKL